MSVTSFVTAGSVNDVLAALASGARPVAGGTDLVVGARSGKSTLPESLVAIHRVAELRGVTVSVDGLRLGALASHEAICENSDVKARYSALADACAIVGSHATRAQGTVGGNLMNASPAMETGGPLICLGATVTLRSAGGERTIDVADLFTGPGGTVAEPGELLIRVDVPAPSARSGSAYLRLEYRRQMEIAVVAASALITLDNGGTVTAARVAMTALAPTIRRVAEAEAALVGSDGGSAAIEAAGAAVAAAAQPISDVRGSADYRRAMAAVIAGRAITQALSRARA